MNVHEGNRIDEPELQHAQEPAAPQRKVAGPEEKAMMHELITVAQQTFAPWREHMMKRGASPNSDMLLASAMASFGGAIVGELVAMGLCPESSVAAILDSHRTNAETGVALGKKHVARVADELLKEEARQQGTGTKQ